MYLLPTMVKLTKNFQTTVFSLAYLRDHVLSIFCIENGKRLSLACSVF